MRKDDTGAVVDARAARWAQFSKERGLKSTRQRDVVLAVFLECGGHVSVEEVVRLASAVLPAIGYVTVYRTMKLLVEAGVASSHDFGDGCVRYEPAMVGGEHHDHLHCRQCRLVLEFVSPEIEAAQAAVASFHGFALSDHRLILWGNCRSWPHCSRRLGSHNHGATE